MSKQNSELQSAINDISVIRQTLERSKVHFGKLSNLFIIFGGTQLAVYILQAAARFFCVENDFLLGLNIIACVKYITLAVLFVFFLRLRREVKDSGNIYTLQLFNIWGIILFAVPLIKFIVMLAQPIFIGAGELPKAALFAYVCADVTEYVSVIIGVLATGCILNKRQFKIGGYCLLCAYPLLFFIGSRNVNTDTIMAAYGYFCSANAAMRVITLILYIAIGIVFKAFNGGGKNGAE